jgi:hypothetical protein
MIVEPRVFNPRTVGLLMADTDPKLSKVVFGSEYRLALLYSVATSADSELYPKSVGDRCGLGARASDELRRLGEVGLLERMPSEPGSRRVLYRRVPAPLWEAIISLVEG